MDKLIDVKIEANEEIIVKANYIFLEPYASGLERKFSLRSVYFKDDYALENFISTVKIYIRLYSNTQGSYSFDFCVSVWDFSFTVENPWFIGMVSTDDSITYEQGVIDIFDEWQKGRTFEWFEYPEGHYLKKCYLDAVFVYSYVSMDIVPRDEYTIDASLVKEEMDIMYLAGIALFGDRGYVGKDWFTLKDCLIDLFNSKSIGDKTIVFLNTSSIHDSKGREIIERAGELFVKYGFKVLFK